MQAHIQKWGNSLGIRIPAHIAKQLHIRLGSPITLAIEHGRLVIEPPQYDLDSMLEGITSKNKHHIALDGSTKGNEEW